MNDPLPYTVGPMMLSIGNVFVGVSGPLIADSEVADGTDAESLPGGSVVVAFMNALPVDSLGTPRAYF
jgi:hypothetical protein